MIVGLPKLTLDKKHLFVKGRKGQIKKKIIKAFILILPLKGDTERRAEFSYSI